MGGPTLVQHLHERDSVCSLVQVLTDMYSAWAYGPVTKGGAKRNHNTPKVNSFHYQPNTHSEIISSFE